MPAVPGGRGGRPAPAALRVPRLRQALVHRHCLETWRRTSDKEDATYRCGECKDEYRDAR